MRRVSRQPVSPGQERGSNIPVQAENEAGSAPATQVAGMGGDSPCCFCSGWEPLQSARGALAALPALAAVGIYHPETGQNLTILQSMSTMRA